MPPGIGYNGQPPTDDVGAELAGPPENENVGKWREFLTRPENMATALVVLAGVTSPRGHGQSKLNKALSAGVGGLGFRGGLEKGVEAHRAGLREEQRTVEAQDAEIAAQQAATAVSQGNLEVNQGTLGVNQQLANQAGRARPLAPSQIALNEAQAAALGRDPDAIPDDFNSQFQRNIELFVENSPGVAPNVAEIALQTTQQRLITKLGEEGRISAAGFDVTPEEASVLGIELPPDPDPELDPDATGVIADATPSLRRSGRDAGFFDEHLSQLATARQLREQGDFEEQTDTEILDTLAEIRTLAQDEKRLTKMSVEQLREILSTYEKVLSTREARMLRRLILEKTQIVQPRAERLTNRRSFQ